MLRDGLGAGLGQSDRDRQNHRLFSFSDRDGFMHSLATRGRAGGTSEAVSAVTGWCDIFHPVSVENEPNKWKRTKAGHAADMRHNVWTMQLWTGSVLTEKRWRVIGRRGHLPASISSTSMLLRAKEKTEDRGSECVSPERR